MALTDQGSIFTWGGTLHGKSGLGPDAGKQAIKYRPKELLFFKENDLIVTQISCGQNHSLAIAYKQTAERIGKPQLYSWGDQ